jgi:hypothetical protein
MRQALHPVRGAADAGQGCKCYIFPMSKTQISASGIEHCDSPTTHPTAMTAAAAAGTQSTFLCIYLLLAAPIFSCPLQKQRGAKRDL